MLIGNGPSSLVGPIYYSVNFLSSMCGFHSVEVPLQQKMLFMAPAGNIAKSYTDIKLKYPISLINYNNVRAIPISSLKRQEHKLRKSNGTRGGRRIIRSSAAIAVVYSDSFGSRKSEIWGTRNEWGIGITMAQPWRGSCCCYWTPKPTTTTHWHNKFYLSLSFSFSFSFSPFPMLCLSIISVTHSCTNKINTNFHFSFFLG